MEADAQLGRPPGLWDPEEAGAGRDATGPALLSESEGEPGAFSSRGRFGLNPSLSPFGGRGVCEMLSVLGTDSSAGSC